MMLTFVNSRGNMMRGGGGESQSTPLCMKPYHSSLMYKPFCAEWGCFMITHGLPHIAYSVHVSAFAVHVYIYCT